MTRDEFLNDMDVRQMVEWLRQRAACGGGFTHRYTTRRPAQHWACDGLYDAFRQYTWNEKDWAANKVELDCYRVRLRHAVKEADRSALLEICDDVLLWGGVWPRNGAYVRRRHGVLLEEITHLAAALSLDREPSKKDIRRDSDDPDTVCRMNAGFVKIYSLLLDHFVIYDGRVGAALGLLVRRFCEQSGLPTVPPLLAFAYGNPKEATSANRKQRNPTRGPYRFPALVPANDHRHCVHAMRASWLLRETLATGQTLFSAGEDGFHELAAALFMVGYDLKGDDTVVV